MSTQPFVTTSVDTSSTKNASVSSEAHRLLPRAATKTATNIGSKKNATTTAFGSTPLVGSASVIPRAALNIAMMSTAKAATGMATKTVTRATGSSTAETRALLCQIKSAQAMPRPLAGLIPNSMGPTIHRAPIDNSPQSRDRLRRVNPLGGRSEIKEAFSSYVVEHLRRAHF